MIIVQTKILPFQPLFQSTLNFQTSSSITSTSTCNFYIYAMEKRDFVYRASRLIQEVNIVNASDEFDIETPPVCVSIMCIWPTIWIISKFKIHKIL